MGVLSLTHPIPLQLQLSDGADDRYVQATIRDPAGNILAQAACPHYAGGLYIGSSIAMPDVTFVVVQFEVFKDAGFTIPDIAYSRALDLFNLAESQVVIKALGEILAVVENPGVFATIDPVGEITAQVDDEEIQGILADLVLDSTLGAQEITATVTC